MYFYALRNSDFAVSILSLFQQTWNRWVFFASYFTPRLFIFCGCLFDYSILSTFFHFVYVILLFCQVMNQYGIVLDVHIHMAIVFIPIVLSTWVRNLKYLVPISTVANFLIFFGYVATIYIMCDDLPPIQERKYVADWTQIPLFFGTVIYSFEGITLVRFWFFF